MHDSTLLVPSARDRQLGLAAVGVAITAWGITGVLIKSVDMDAIAIAFWRFLVYALLLTAWQLSRRQPITWRVLRLAAPGGLLLAGDVMLFFTAVRITNVVNATTIGALQPLVVGVAAARLFGERVRGLEIGAAIVAIAGVVVVITQSSGTPEWSGAGDLAAVGALASWSAYFIVAKRTAGSLTPMEFTVGTAWWVTAGSLVGGLVVGQDLGIPPTSEWLPLLTLVTFGGFLGHMVLNWALPRVPLWLSSTLTLLIPVFSSLAAWAFLDEALTLWQLLAMGVVVAALAVIVLTQSEPTPVLPPQAPIDVAET